MDAKKLSDIKLILRAAGATMHSACEIADDVAMRGPAVLLTHGSHWRHTKPKLANACDALSRLLAEDPLAAREAPYRAQVRDPYAALAVLRSVVDPSAKSQEHFWAILLDARQKPIGTPVLVSKGSCDQVNVHPRDVFRVAIERNAHSVVVAHNHPSCDVTPSSADIELTRRLKDAGVLCGIPVLDHLIIAGDGTTGRHYSFGANGLL